MTVWIYILTGALLALALYWIKDLLAGIVAQSPEENEEEKVCKFFF